MILSTAYFPPVSWFAALASGFTLSPSGGGVDSFPVMIEACENYQKQSWRNRARIMTANGPETISFPVVHSTDMAITKVMVDYSTPWVVRTQRAISSAYESSPFFEYYKDGIFSILESRPDTLWELNMKITEFMISKFRLPVSLVPTTEFLLPDKGVPDDLRYRIHPKRPDNILSELGLERPYYQVFSSKFGFVGGLSAMDLLFNMGPESIMFLKRI